jgi:hypothetical protein
MMLHVLQFLARVFEVGAFVAIFFVVASLLESEVVMGWAVQLRRLLKRHSSEQITHSRAQLPRRRLPMSSLDKNPMRTGRRRA